MNHDYDLSVLIPARNEMFLSRTVQNILDNIRGKTEIIVVLDGAWADPGIPDDPRVTIIYHNQSVGQRAATNDAAKISKAKYVMKIDAHCTVDEGFDIKMLMDMKDDWTMIPMMYNLHGFDWVCKCGSRQYQGPSKQFKKCPACGKDREREIIFARRESKKSMYFRFDKALHFQYWGAYGERPEAQGDIVDIMSTQGSCFLLTRKKYWELNICDEGHGSWGQQGVEVACATWLSGGRLVTTKKTWYAHMFRTQGGDFGFPYPLSGSDVEKARKYSRNLWQGNNHPKQIHDFQWLIDKFAPIPDWHTDAEPKKLTKGVVYYTHNVGNSEMLEAVRKQLKKGMKEKHIVSVSLQPIRLGNNIVLDLQPGYLTMAKQILAGLEASTADIIYFAEHDVLYHPKHFDFMPPKKDVYYYNTNVWRVRAEDGHALYCDDLQQLSGLVAYRETLIKHYKMRVHLLENYFAPDNEAAFDNYVRGMGFEPGTHGRKEGVDDLKAENYFAEYPNIDIRHDKNTTPSRWKKEQFRNERYIKGWKESTLQDLPGWDFNVRNFSSI